MNKRKHNSDTTAAAAAAKTRQWKLSDVLVPRADYGQTCDSVRQARHCWQSVVAAMLLGSSPRHVVLHYMQVAAREIEIELRNRQTARLGSLHFDIAVPAELDGEIERRMNVYIDRRQTTLEEQDGREAECDELLRVLNVYQALSELLSGRSTPDCAGLLDECQAMFFCIVHMSRDLQALLFARQHRSRLPQHVPMARADGLRFMEVLRLLTPLYTGEQLNSRQYVERLRKFVFCGSLELDGVDEDENSNTTPTPTKTNNDNNDNDDDEENLLS